MENPGLDTVLPSRFSGRDGFQGVNAKELTHVVLSVCKYLIYKYIITILPQYYFNDIK